MLLFQVTRNLSPRRRPSPVLAAIVFFMGCSFGSIFGLAEAQLKPDPEIIVPPPLFVPPQQGAEPGPVERRGYLWNCERARLMLLGECSPPAAGSQRCVEHLERVLTLCSRAELCGTPANVLSENTLEILWQRACSTPELRAANQDFCLTLGGAIVLWCGVDDPQGIPGDVELERNGTLERDW